MEQYECRVWDGHKCRMSYDYEEISCWHGHLLPEGDSIILLYSGYKDCTARKIYQHDLVEVKGEIKILVWHAGGLCLVAEESALKSVGWYLPYSLGNVPQEDRKVIGNIYEHKHLLKRYNQ